MLMFVRANSMTKAEQPRRHHHNLLYHLDQRNDNSVSAEGKLPLDSEYSARSLDVAHHHKLLHSQQQKKKSCALIIPAKSNSLVPLNNVTSDFTNILRPLA